MRERRDAILSTPIQRQPPSDAYPGETFTARIVQLGQVVNANTRRVTVRARLDNGERKLLPEMFVRANVLQQVGSGVRVANEAIPRSRATRALHDAHMCVDYKTTRVNLNSGDDPPMNRLRLPVRT